MRRTATSKKETAQPAEAGAEEEVGGRPDSGGSFPPPWCSSGTLFSGTAFAIIFAVVAQFWFLRRPARLCGAATMAEDIFPLPSSTGHLPVDAATLPRYLVQRRAAAARKDRMLHETIGAFNGLAAARAAAPLSPMWANRADEPSEAQKVVINRAREDP